MIEKSKAIALHTVRFGESSLVAYVYTYERGRVNLMVNRAYGNGKDTRKAIFFQPLSLLNLVYYPGKSHGMARLKEVSYLHSLSSLHFNPVKRAIGLFVGEVIYRAIREEESNPQLFEFLEVSIQALDAMDQGVPNFHLLFLSQLSRFLGFYPSGQYSETTPYFDFRNGIFVRTEPSHLMFFSPQYSKILSQSLATQYENAEYLHLSGHQRSEFLGFILTYYSYHNDSINRINSLPILSQVFDE